jgi:hypothetical protein
MGHIYKHQTLSEEKRLNLHPTFLSLHQRLLSMDFDKRFEDQRSSAQQQTRQEGSLGGGGGQWDNPSSSGQGK